MQIKIIYLSFTFFNVGSIFIFLQDNYLKNNVIKQKPIKHLIFKNGKQVTFSNYT